MKTDKRTIIIPDYMIVLKTINKFGVMSVTDIHHETRITYAHLHNMKKHFIENEWARVEEVGVKHLISLTELGKSLVIDIIRC